MQKIIIRHNDGYVTLRIHAGDFDFWSYDKFGQPLNEGYVSNGHSARIFAIDANDDIWKEDE
jgi:hypothetical protein